MSNMLTLFISSNSTMASDTGVYTCLVMLTVDGTDIFNYSDTSLVTLIGECA